jgi:serine/tyrosine/threonine adenylyltransferase
MKIPGVRFDNTYIHLCSDLFSKEKPEIVKAPEIIALNSRLALKLGLDLEKADKKGLASVFAGNTIPEGAEPLAQAYAGHQYGNFTMLGDGRAIVLGEHVSPDGNRYDIQLKGSGQTLYSRRGDGRAALGPMLREYIISEAMDALGIPTTRSLAVVKTGETVIRDRRLPGAVLTRIASSHIRIGTFQFAAAHGGLDLVKELLIYTINRHYPDLSDALEDRPALLFLKSIIKRQVSLIVEWMRVGFIHGVMNTDNMAVSGETIDYGPCAFMDYYDPNTVYSSIDQHGRYAFLNQPAIAQWNIARLAETLIPLIDEDKVKAVMLAEEAVESFSYEYIRSWGHMMRGKLGITGYEPEDDKLIKKLLELMQQEKADYTNTFRNLPLNILPEIPFFQSACFYEWYAAWKERIKRNIQEEEFYETLIKENNPAVIPRNHKVEQALEVAVKSGNYEPFEELVSAVITPYEDREFGDEYTKEPLPQEKVSATFCGT